MADLGETGGLDPGKDRDWWKMAPQSEVSPFPCKTPAEGLGGDPEDEMPERIGPYRILSKLSQGGMAVVYFASQEEPVRRTVALKIIRQGMDTGEMRARFKLECNVLASLSHPNVVQFLDAGTSDGGRPYLVMECLRSPSLTEFADERRLTIPERLRLFLQICEGLQHVHSHGVVHRSLAPSNILIDVRSGRPCVKILDFGVCAVIQGPLQDLDVPTEPGRIIGIMEYMSPEQAGALEAEIDTRTDVYALGAILFELLVGTSPWDSMEFRSSSLTDVLGRLREGRRLRPSVWLREMGDASREVTKRRRTDVSSLMRLLRSDLDWITMRAMEREPSRRYATSSEMAADVRRHLVGDSVLAVPRIGGYVAGKFLRRNGLAILTAGAILSIAR